MTVVLVALALAAAAGPLARAQSFSPCDPLTPENCLLPFPNDFYLRPDPTTGTGLRLAISSASLPVANDSATIDPADWLFRDGFGRLMPLSTYFRDVSLDRSRLPRHWDIVRSLDADCPSVLIDTATGERVAHWVEVDERSDDVVSDNHMLMLWPAAPLAYARRYVVAYRTLATESGGAVTPSTAFVQLRDGLPSGDYDVEGRRALYEQDIFPLLERAGYARGSLVIAWEFTVASETNTREPLRFMVRDALERVARIGVDYRILQVTDDVSEDGARHVVGTFRVPWYLNTNQPGGKLVQDGEGMPVYQTEGFAPFSLLIPRSVADGTQPTRATVQFGHGLFQNHFIVLQAELQRGANEFGLVLYATNMHGMASRDVAAISEMLATDVSDAAIIPHSCMQGVVNHLVLTKLVLGALAEDPVVIYNNRSVLLSDDRRLGYLGYSQGGIYGPTITSLSEDIDRGVFGVPGGPFVLLLPRAEPFRPYWAILTGRYKDPFDRLNLLSALQILWDHVENVGWVDELATNPRKKTQIIWAKGDAQVTYLGANNMARGMGARTFSNIVTGRANETQYGINIIAGTSIAFGHIIMGYEFNVPEVPIYNTPPDRNFDTHNFVYAQQSFVERTAALLLREVHEQVCPGPCTFDEARR